MGIRKGGVEGVQGHSRGEFGHGCSELVLPGQNQGDMDVTTVRIQNC